MKSITNMMSQTLRDQLLGGVVAILCGVPLVILADRMPAAWFVRAVELLEPRVGLSIAQDTVVVLATIPLLLLWVCAVVVVSNVFGIKRSP